MHPYQAAAVMLRRAAPPHPFAGLQPVLLRDNSRSAFALTQARRILRACRAQLRRPLRRSICARASASRPPNLRTAIGGGSGTQARSISTRRRSSQSRPLKLSAQRGVHRNGTPATSSKRQSTKQDHYYDYTNTSIAKRRWTTATSAPRHVAEMERGRRLSRSRWRTTSGRPLPALGHGARLPALERPDRR